MWLKHFDVKKGVLESEKTRFWVSGRQPFLYPIREELPVIRPRLPVRAEGFVSEEIYRGLATALTC
jgi:hypothetical protein